MVSSGIFQYKLAETEEQTRRDVPNEMLNRDVRVYSTLKEHDRC